MWRGDLIRHAAPCRRCDGEAWSGDDPCCQHFTAVHVTSALVKVDFTYQPLGTRMLITDSA